MTSKIYTKNVYLKEPTRLLLNQAKAKILTKYPEYRTISDNLIIHIALQNYLNGGIKK